MSRFEKLDRRSLLKIVLGFCTLAAVAVGGLAWWLGYFTDPPAEATLEASVEAVTSADNTVDTADDETGSDDTAVDETGADTTIVDATDGDDQAVVDVEETEALDGISGIWNVQPNEEATFVGYRINEVLNTIGGFEVVARTGEVAGTLEVDGTVISAVDLTVQMDTLTTDNSRRDASMREQALESEDFPLSTFVLTTAIDVGSIPAAGETIAVTATGDFTLHGVTQAIDFPLEAQIVNDLIVVVGQLQISLSDYDISAPQAPIVASVEEVALLELSVVFSR
jgi:polyisoprenoid-binding protein YceI